MSHKNAYAAVLNNKVKNGAYIGTLITRALCTCSVYNIFGDIVSADLLLEYEEETQRVYDEMHDSCVNSKGVFDAEEFYEKAMAYKQEVLRKYAERRDHDAEDLGDSIGADERSEG